MIKEIVKICGLTKSEILKKLSRFEDSGVSFEVDEDCLDAKITMSTPRSNRKFEDVKCAVYNTFQNEVYSATDASLLELVGHFLKVNGRVLGVAESLTGGEICSRLTEIPGISECFYEGIVCYNIASKAERLGVRRETLEKYGAISKQTAYEMVQGITAAPVDIGLATTGLAGPSGDEGKPVGLVYIGVGAGEFILVFERKFKGSRNHIRKCTANVALFYLLRYLNGDIWTL